MYSRMKFVALASVFALILLGSFAYAEETDTGHYEIYEPGLVSDSALATSYGQYTPGNMAMEPTVGRALEASDLLGYRLYGAGSEFQGTISDYVIDETNGRIALVVLSDVPGYGARKVAIPFSFLTRTEGGSFTINFPPDAPVSAFQSDFDKPYAQAFAPGEVDRPIDSSFVDLAYDQFGVAPYWTEGGMKAKMGCYLYSELRGDYVGMTQGTGTARVEDFVFDSSDGRIALLIFGDVPGRNNSYVAVPFSLLSRQDDHTFALSISSDKLASAPTFKEDADVSNRAYAETVYRYYGIQPYWTEDGMMSH